MAKKEREVPAIHIRKVLCLWLRLVPLGQADAFVDRVVAKKYEGFADSLFTYTRRVRLKGKKSFINSFNPSYFFATTLSTNASACPSGTNLSHTTASSLTREKKKVS
jgi:hypothetical protein